LHPQVDGTGKSTEQQIKGRPRDQLQAIRLHRQTEGTTGQQDTIRSKADRAIGFKQIACVGKTTEQQASRTPADQRHAINFMQQLQSSSNLINLKTIACIVKSMKQQPGRTPADQRHTINFRKQL
jgi:hypothetical protein